MNWRRDRCSKVMDWATESACRFIPTPTKLGLLVGFLLVAFPCLGLDQTNSVADRFSTEAATGLERLEKSFQSVSATVKWSRKTHSTDFQKYAPDYQGNQVRKIWFAGSSGKVIIDYYNAEGVWKSRKVYCFNPDYGFVAAQSIQDGPYILASYGINNDQAMARARLSVLDFVRDLQWTYDLVAEYRTLGQIVRSPDFHLISCVERKEGERRVVDAEFSFTPPGGSWVGPSGSPISAKATFDPAADWRLLSTVVKGATWNRQSQNTYTPDELQPGAISKMVRHNTSTDGLSADDYSLDISSLSFAMPAFGEFRLGSVGLPELSVKKGWGFWRLVLIGGNILLIGLLLFFYSRRRENRRNQSMVPTKPKN